jgi:proteasome beta subunit
MDQNTMKMANEEVSKNIAKTGTTILGIKCKDGAVIAADRRVTMGGMYIAQKDIKKIRQVNDYLIVAIAGNAADAILLTKVIGAELRLKELKTKSRPTIEESANLIAMSSYRNIRTPSMVPNIVGTINGGFNEDGTVELYSTSPGGDLRNINDYDSNGSGMMFVIGLLERQYKKDITVKEATELAKECLKSSTQRDPASGNGIDVFAITKDSVKHVVSEEIVPQFK